ncbi:MAG: N-6 DNA methylase [Alphaproteobacteria bacterium]|nr:N-6 DNA methylase [Alphaproteobacteria bacterium]
MKESDAIRRLKENLLNIPSNANESVRQQKVASWFEAYGIELETQRQTGAGPADIHFKHRYCIIEMKTSDELKLGPKSSKSGSESPFQQISRYINAERKLIRLDNSNVKWRGIVTDGVRWWAWEWPLPGEGDRPTLLPGWNGTILNENNLYEMKNIIDRPVGKPWVPSSLKGMFGDSLLNLKKLYAESKNDRATRTQKQLWLEQLKAGGNKPDESEDDLFIAHTLLILISRLVSKNSMSHENLAFGSQEDVLDGFVGWVTKSNGELDAIDAVVKKYDWGPYGGDVLRRLYKDFVSKSQRRRYGEYYTPDWLVEKICDDMITEKYIERQLNVFEDGSKSVNGILDPACGSGTFLFHAAKKILRSTQLNKSTLSAQEKTDFICELINGIDIHPIAVEMAIANMKRILPLADPSRIRIHQGDSLLLNRPSQNIHANDKNNIILYSPQNRALVIPKDFLRGNGSRIKKFVIAARDRKKMPDILYTGLDEKGKATLKEAFKTITEIIVAEGNRVWSWYIKNQTAPIFMSEKPSMAMILSNPPWVRNSEMPDKERKRKIQTLAKELGLWVGAKRATSFDIASLFVVWTMINYLHKTGTAAWVLPQGAMITSGQWEKMRNKIKEDKKIHQWDVGSLPFKQHAPASLLFTKNGINKKMILKKDEPYPAENDLWDSVKDKIKMGKPDAKITPSRSRYMDSKKIRNGATIFPKPLVCIDSKTIVKVGNKIKFTTLKGRHNIWKGHTESGIVPNIFIKDCVFSGDIIPYCAPTITKCIIPIHRNQWMDERLHDTFWKTISDRYAGAPKYGKTTPPTIEKRLNHMSALFAQLGREKNTLVYTKSGARMFAAPVAPKIIIDNSLYLVQCKSMNEMLFLTGILNADCLQHSFNLTKEAPRHYDMYIWKKMPIPLYAPGNSLHQKLVGLTKDAMNISKKSFIAGSTTQKARDVALAACEKSGISSKIDAVVSKILPDYSE